jgi:hypothetical protein
MPHLTWYWTDGRGSGNSKTGKIPTAYPADRHDAWKVCEGCPLRKDTFEYSTPDNPTCYFWWGQGATVFPILTKAAARGKDYTLATALKNRLQSARAVRMSGGSDSSATHPSVYRQWYSQVKAAGLAWLDYTHFWKTRGNWLKGLALASCESWEEAHEAVKAGWRAAVHVSTLPELQGKHAGLKYTLCPAQRKGRQKPVTCNTCRLCDASKPVVPVIVFLNH